MQQLHRSRRFRGGDFASVELKDRPYISYTVTALLIRISSFLLDDQLSFALSKATPTRAIFLANEFKCKTFPHNGAKPFPHRTRPHRSRSTSSLTQVIITIMGLLPVSSVCRSLYQICQDDVLWQALFKRNHPHS
ncbi:hypothetical protein PROFUN_03206 [Planoprotostelium fungivorum]|uniref:F-box domain-containing protein n=1 Tax=Planoprotostelium fungivorum TaxID=1890364 RepID=A0A2P6NX15_9EUKA|nr:hypothetical protein PROFUN_03206 [Planoprotostelium fungivorum]